MDYVAMWLVQVTDPVTIEPSITGVFSELLKTAPHTVAVLIVVWFFLKFIKDAREENERRHDERNEKICEFHEAQTETMKGIATDCKEVIRDNTAAMRENSAALGRAK